MNYDGLREEVEYYIRKIRILEDWFNFVFTKGYVSGGDGLRIRLNEIRPAVLPSVTDLRSMSKGHLVEVAAPLSLYAQRLDDIRHEVFKTNKVHGWLRAGIANVMLKLESGEISNWTSPFTCGMHPLDHVFGPVLHRDVAVKFNERS